MSEAKVLTAKQQRKTLSNAKKKKKAPVRNVYGHPRGENWPVLSSVDESIILNHMRKQLCSKGGKSLIRTVLASSSTKESGASQQIEFIRKELVVGLRKVIVDIENGNLKCLLLSNEVDPPTLGYLVGNLAAAHNVPFVAVSNLKSILEELLGFKSWCVGFTVSSKHFDLICDKVKTVVNDLKERTQQESFSIVEDAKQTCSSVRKVKNISDLHLYRADKSKRVFIPEPSTSQGNTESSFLSFSKDAVGDATFQKDTSLKPDRKSAIMQKFSFGSQRASQSSRYFDKVPLLPLQVKRFQENPNKQKWKKSNNRALKSGQQSL